MSIGPLHLYGVESSSLDLPHPVFPQLSRHPLVVHRAGDVPEGLAVLEEGVVLVVDGEASAAKA